jgi:hypothetical protein
VAESSGDEYNPRGDVKQLKSDRALGSAKRKSRGRPATKGKSYSSDVLMDVCTVVPAYKTTVKKDYLSYKTTSSCC